MPQPPRRSLRALAIIAAASLAAQQSFGSGYEFEGLGAREVSRGGAAIADSNNWTAIYWNPANLKKAVEQSSANIGVEIFGGQANATDSNSLSALPVGARFSRNHLSSGFVLGAVGAALRAGDRFAVGLGFYTPLLQGVEFTDSSPLSGMDLRYEASAGILTWALEAAAELAEGFHAGAGVNVLYGRLELDSHLTQFLLAGNEATSRVKADGVALEGIFGLRYEPTAKLTLGAVYRTGADVTLEGDSRVSHTNPSLPDESTSIRYQLRHPPTAGVGVAFRPVSRWTLNADVTRTWWSRFTNATDYRTQGLFQADTPNTFRWRDAWKFKVGTGYHVTGNTELLAGYSYDRAALDPGSVDFSTTIDVPMNRFYLGAAHRWSDGWETILGGVYGSGSRREQGIHYRLSGWQVMLESQWRVGPRI